jgi:hypothetical protein
MIAAMPFTSWLRPIVINRRTRVRARLPPALCPIVKNLARSPFRAIALLYASKSKRLLSRRGCKIYGTYPVPSLQSVVYLSRGLVFWCKPVVHRDDNARQALGELSTEGVLGV